MTKMAVETTPIPERRILRKGRNPLPDFGPIEIGEEVIVDVSSMWREGSPSFAPDYYFLNEKEGFGATHFHLYGFHFTCENHAADFQLDAVVSVNGKPIRNLKEDIKLTPSDAVAVKVLSSTRKRVWAMIYGAGPGEMRLPWRKESDEKRWKQEQEQRDRVRNALFVELARTGAAFSEAFPPAFLPAF